MKQKNHISDLAVFGGHPAFAEKLHVGRPNIGNREHLLDRINDLLDRRWLTNRGPFVQEFEARIADLAGVKHCIAMCNGTIALEIATRALGLTGEVLVPAFTFVATAHALQWQEITPVFCDIDPETYTIDPKQLEKMITPRTTGIIGVHLWGRVCNVIELTEIARRHNLNLLFDASHALACSERGRMVGSFGDAEVFSFHATKFINTFEGGAVVTNNDELAERIRLMKNFGFVGMDNVDYIGTNGKMNEVSAAMGITSLESLDEFIAVNHRNYKQYVRALADIPGIKLLTFDQREECNYQYIVIEVDEKLAGITRDHLFDILHRENVLARRYFYPGCHKMEPYRSYFPHAHLLLANTDRIGQRVLSLPTGTAIGEKEVTGTCAIIRFVVENSAEISARLGDQAYELKRSA